MASDETYRITIAAELDDRTEAAIRRVRSRVSAWEREEDRRRTRTLRREREAQRHHTHQARQQAV